MTLSPEPDPAEVRVSLENHPTRRHETESIQLGADHRRAEGVRGRRCGQGSLPSARHQRADLLPLVVEVRRTRGELGSPPGSARRGERATEACSRASARTTRRSRSWRKKSGDARRASSCRGLPPLQLRSRGVAGLQVAGQPRATRRSRRRAPKPPSCGSVSSLWRPSVGLSAIRGCTCCCDARASR